MLDAERAKVIAELAELDRDAEAALAETAPDLARQRRQKRDELAKVERTHAKHTRRVLGDCRPIGARLLSEVPPPDYLLRLPNGDDDERGFLERAIVGLIVAPPSAGKSMAAIQLGIAVATGLPWLDHFETCAPGRVLLLLGEHTQRRADRRIQRLAAMMGILPEKAAELRLAGSVAHHARHARAADDLAKNLFAEPLAGKNIALQRGDRDGPHETDFADELRAFLADNAGPDGWRLVVIDTLARAGGPLAERDNFAATELVRTLETLRDAPGNPTVLVLHHTPKGRLNEPSDIDSARGSSALSGGVQWMVNLEPVENEPRLRLRLTKTNDGPARMRPTVLARERFGFLRVLAEHEASTEALTPAPRVSRARPTRGGATGADRAAGEPTNGERKVGSRWT